MIKIINNSKVKDEKVIKLDDRIIKFAKEKNIKFEEQEKFIFDKNIKEIQHIKNVEEIIKRYTCNERKYLNCSIYYEYLSEDEKQIDEIESILKDNKIRKKSIRFCNKKLKESQSRAETITVYKYSIDELNKEQCLSCLYLITDLFKTVIKNNLDISKKCIKESQELEKKIEELKKIRKC